IDIRRLLCKSEKVFHLIIIQGSMAIRRGIWLGVLVVLVAAFVAACGGGGQQGGGQPAGTPAGSAVTVSEKEWTIQFASSTVKPGKVKLLIKNGGNIQHNF